MNQTPECERIRSAMRDFAGGFGDLGTLLPLTLAVLAVTSLPAAGVLTAFGIAYLLTAWFYRAPIPVQPMKVAAAVLVTTAPEPAVAAGAALVLGLFFTLAGATGVIEAIARAVPRVVTAALQLGLAASLGLIALQQIMDGIGLALGLLILLIYLVAYRPGWPAAVLLLAAGVAGAQLLGTGPAGPMPAPTPTLPAVAWPDLEAILQGTMEITLPQIPLTLTNAVLVTAAVGREHFPHARHLTENRLAVTTGLTNLVATPLSGMPICHGAGGITAHYRFGARSGLAPVCIGVVLLALGIGWGADAAAVLTYLPPAALGVLLLLPAIDLARSARPLAFRGHERSLLLVGALLAFWSPGLAFLATVAVTLLLRRYMSPHR